MVAAGVPVAVGLGCDDFVLEVGRKLPVLLAVGVADAKEDPGATVIDPPAALACPAVAQPQTIQRSVSYICQNARVEKSSFACLARLYG